MFKNYFKTAIRNLWNNKSYSLLNILGLSVGITCAALIFLWVEDELNYNKNNAKINHVYQVMENQPFDAKTYTFSATPGVLAQSMKAEIPGIKNTSRATWRQNTLFNIGEKSIYEMGAYVDSSMFSIFTIPFIKGNASTAFNQLNTLVISEKMANSFFGSTDVVGKYLKVDNKEDYVITGVYKDMPENSSYKYDWMAPFEVYFKKNDWLKEWGNNGILTFVEVEPKADVSAINKKLYGYIQSKDTSAVAKPFLFSMKDWRLRSNFTEGKQDGGRIEYVNLFTTIAWIILLIACINFMNLATARSEKRSREVGVRKVLGAQKKMLILQFIGEAMIMSLIAVIIAVGFIYVALPFFNTLVEKKLYLALNNPVHNTALLGIALICGLVAGSYPAIYLSSFNPTSVLKGLKVKAGSAAIIRKALVVIQFSVSIILIISTIIIYQQIQHIKSRQLGYNKNGLIELGATGEIPNHFEAIKDDLIKTGAATNASLCSTDMLEMGSSSDNFSWEGKDPNKKVLITVGWVSPEHLSTTGLKLKEGRDFQPVAKLDSSNIIINETLASMMQNDPVGQIIRQDTTPYRVIGVVHNFIYGDMYGKTEPLIFFCNPSRNNYMYVRLTEGRNVEQSVAQIQNVLKRDNPGFPFDYRFVDDRFNNLFKSEMLIGTLSRVFAFLAIFISCLGLFGLAAYTAERRTKEIGIRKVLGASVQGITTLLSTDFLKLVIISVVIAFPVAWWMMHKWLQDYAYHISINWLVFIIAGLSAIFIALLTISFQAFKAAISSPVKNLRTE